MVTRIAMSASAAATILILLPTAASAGEVTEKGRATGAPGCVASECAFSGREDDPASPLRTQTPHEVFFDFVEPGFVVNPAPGTPGRACNPAKAGG